MHIDVLGPRPAYAASDTVRNSKNMCFFGKSKNSAIVSCMRFKE